MCQVKVKVHTLDVAPLRSETSPQKSSGMARVLRGFQFYLHSHTFIRNGKEPYLSLPSQPQLVFIYRSRRDGRLSRPSCEIVQAEIRTCNFPIANPALYHTATSAPYGRIQKKIGGKFTDMRRRRRGYRDTKGVEEGWGLGRRCPPPQPTIESAGERHELPQPGPGQSPNRRCLFNMF